MLGDDSVDNLLERAGLAGLAGCGLAEFDHAGSDVLQLLAAEAGPDLGLFADEPGLTAAMVNHDGQATPDGFTPRLSVR